MKNENKVSDRSSDVTAGVCVLGRVGREGGERARESEAMR